MITRRTFCAAGAGALLATRRLPADAPPAAARTRGVVLVPEDLSLADWPQRAARCGLSTIGIHHQQSPLAVIDWVRSDAGQQFLERCRALGLHVEYELHAMQELLPRDLFRRNPELFRLNAEGQRVPDANCCVHSARALAIVAENAAAIAQGLRPTTGRYFFWGDDGQPWCACNECRGLSPAEQALLVENRVLAALRAVDPRATLAHLAYANTLPPPAQVRPAEGLFLEFAPIRRRYDAPLEEQRDPQQADGLELLAANLAVFPTDTAQVLEYWLDVSRFSQWRRPAVRLPWNRAVFAADVTAYRQRGIRHFTSFAVWIDADYRDRFGEPDFLAEYGAGLPRD